MKTFELTCKSSPQFIYCGTAFDAKRLNYYLKHCFKDVYTLTIKEDSIIIDVFEFNTSRVRTFNFINLGE